MRHYTSNTLVNLRTRDNQIITHYLPTLVEKFHHIKKLASKTDLTKPPHEIMLNIDALGLDLALYFGDTLLIPDQEDDIILLLESLDYLRPTERYMQHLTVLLDEYLKEKKGIEIMLEISLLDYSRKLQDPGYLTYGEKIYLESEKKYFKK